MSASDFLEDKIRDLFSGTDATAAAAYYIALYTSATTDSGGGADETTRVAISFTAGSNDILALIPSLTAGTYTHGALWDDPTAATGNMWVHGALTNPKTVTTGESLAFVVGSVDIVPA
jgi:hypothetical protein